jgi:hypothetical protein
MYWKIFEEKYYSEREAERRATFPIHKENTRAGCVF